MRALIDTLFYSFLFPSQFTLYRFVSAPQSGHPAIFYFNNLIQFYFIVHMPLTLYITLLNPPPSSFGSFYFFLSSDNLV